MTHCNDDETVTTSSTLCTVYARKAIVWLKSTADWYWVRVLQCLMLQARLDVFISLTEV